MCLAFQTSPFVPLENCNRYDVRLEPEVSPKCSYYTPENPALPEGIEMAYLFPKSLARSRDDEFNILITSNMVPMQREFITGKVFFTNTLLFMKYEKAVP